MKAARKPIRRKGKARKTTEHLDSLVRQILLLRDTNGQGEPCCQKCGRTGKGLEVSHVKPKGKYPWLRFDLLNVKLLCFSCHFPWWHRDPTASAAWFANTFSARAAYLGVAAQKPELMNKSFKEKVLHELTEKLAELENEI